MALSGRIEGDVVGSALMKLVEGAADLGVRAEDLTTRQLETLREPGAMIPLEELAVAWERVLERAEGASLVELAARYDTKDFELLGYLAATSATLADALDALLRYLPLWIRGPRWDRSGQDTVCLRYVFEADRRRPGSRYLVESALVQLVSVARVLTGDPRLRPVLVRFNHPEPERSSRAYSDFFGAPVIFRAPDDAVLFSRALLELPIPTGHPDVRAFLEEQAKRRSEAPTVRPTLGALVAQMLAEEGAIGSVRASTLAERLHFSERSFRRKLADEGTSFRALVDAALESAAAQLLRRREEDVEAIATALGFGSGSAFARAFRRATGLSPSEYRARLAEDS